MVYNQLKEIIVIVSLLMTGELCYAVPEYLVGKWITTPNGNYENIELCIDESEVKFQWTRTGEIMASEVEAIKKLDDVFVISFLRDDAILRKLILVYRDVSSDLVGQIHMYDGFHAFNYFPVNLQKSSDECDISKRPVNRSG